MNLEELLTPETKADGDIVYGKPGACLDCGREYVADLVDVTPAGRQVFWYRVPDACCSKRARAQATAFRRWARRYELDVLAGKATEISVRAEVEDLKRRAHELDPGAR